IRGWKTYLRLTDLTPVIPLRPVKIHRQTYLRLSLVVFEVVFLVVGLPLLLPSRLGFQDMVFGDLTSIARGRLHDLMISFCLPFQLCSFISLQLSTLLASLVLLRVCSVDLEDCFWSQVWTHVSRGNRLINTLAACKVHRGNHQRDSNSPLDDANGLVIWENTNTGVSSSDVGGIPSWWQSAQLRVYQFTGHTILYQITVGAPAYIATEVLLQQEYDGKVCGHETNSSV
ncbi:hypothetical protein HID58_075566, partial [Brassica napus]